MTEHGFRDLLNALYQTRVRYILIGGLAGMAHGSSRATVDVDVVYERSHDNLERIVKSLKPFHPYLRGVPRGLPFLWDTRTLEQGLNFTLTTDIGDIDLFGEVVGNGVFERLTKTSETIDLFGLPVECVSLDDLIQLKRAAGRPKDLEAIAELETIRDEQI